MAALIAGGVDPSQVGKSAVDGDGGQVGAGFLEFVGVVAVGGDFGRANKSEIGGVEEEDKLFSVLDFGERRFGDFGVDNGLGGEVRGFRCHEGHRHSPCILKS